MVEVRELNKRERLLGEWAIEVCQDAAEKGEKLTIHGVLHALGASFNQDLNTVLTMLAQRFGMTKGH